jgi:hypothetical protein
VTRGYRVLVPFEERRTLTKQEALAWNDKWDAIDRACISNAIDVALAAHPDAVLYTPPTGGYIGLEISDGPLPLMIHPGRIEWPHGETAGLDQALIPAAHMRPAVIDLDDLVYRWLPLSTAQEPGDQARASERHGETCPLCFMEIPVSGDHEC